MKRMHIIGGKKHGKTQLIVELVEEMIGRGLRVGTIKHTHHRHELDTPGKDSHRHRLAGAAVVGILSQSMSVVYMPTEHDTSGEECYAALTTMFNQCDVVLVEGDTQTDAPKIEVWRAEMGKEPLAVHDSSILAVITDDLLNIQTQVIPRLNIVKLTDWILAHLLGVTKRE